MKRLPFEVSVAKPCQQQWNDMSGTSAQRHCDSCNKTVHNFAAMTRGRLSDLWLQRAATSALALDAMKMGP